LYDKIYKMLIIRGNNNFRVLLTFIIYMAVKLFTSEWVVIVTIYRYCTCYTSG